MPYKQFFMVLVLVGLLWNCGEKQSTSETSLEATGNPAIDNISAAIKINPDDPTLFAARAALLYENESYDNAINDLNKALSIDSMNVDYLHLLADVYLDYFKSRLALETLEKAANFYPKNTPTLLKLAEFQMILTKYEASLQTIDQILRQDRQTPPAYFLMGMNLKEMGDTIRAINSFQEAVDMDAQLIEGWLQLGQLYATRKDPLALQYFNNAVKIAPNSVEANHAKAYYLTNTLNDLEGAIAIYRSINLIDPQYEEAYYNAGLLYLDLEKLSEAYQQFNLAIQFSPTHIRAYYYRGYTNELLGNSDAAKLDYEQALRMSPDYEAAKERLTALQGG
ncbi:MAG: tetratricopeptide repeat protein [Saprospiraceae bacterium]|nr:tetratricopeptide repeat protein [Saprospiraceae bacterium]